MWSGFSEATTQLLEKLGGWFQSIIVALPNILLASIVLVVSIYMARNFKKLIIRTLKHTTQNQTVIGVISNISVAVFMLFTLFIILNIMNLSEAVTALLGTAGVIGLALGLALQDPLINLFSGVLMSVKNYYQVGDLIDTNGYFGKIQEITLRSTVLEQPDGQEVIIPNKEVIQTPLTNFSHNGRRRIQIECGVSYGDDLDEVEEIAMDAIKNAGISFSRSKSIDFYYTSFGDSSVNFRILFWQDIVDQGAYLKAQHKAIKALKKAFDQNNVTIPFPVTTLDFGAVGGVSVNDIYPPRSLYSTGKNQKVS